MEENVNLNNNNAVTGRKVRTMAGGKTARF